MADGGSREYLGEPLGFHFAKGKSLETNGVVALQKTCKKDKRMRAASPAKNSWKGWHSMQDFFLNTPWLKQSFQGYLKPSVDFRFFKKARISLDASYT